MRALQQARAVGDDQRAAARIFIQPTVQRIQKLSFGPGVQTLGRLIQQQDGRVLHKGSRQGDPARLTA